MPELICAAKGGRFHWLRSFSFPQGAFDKLINVGDKTIYELEFFKADIENYVREIQNLKDEELRSFLFLCKAKIFSSTESRIINL